MKSKYQNNKELTITFENGEIDDLFTLLCRSEADRNRNHFERLEVYSKLRAAVEEALSAD
jgi:hypothetical protein